MVKVNLNGPGTVEEKIDKAKQEYFKSLSPEQIKTQDLYRKQTSDYKIKYIQYMGNIIDADSLQEDVTQPYYQSLLLNRRRLDEKNIDIGINMVTNPTSDLLPFEAKKDEKFSTGERQDALEVTRSFMRFGKKIGKIRTKETCKITFLNLNVNEKEETFCPNCGYADTLSGFINGCDACGARFTVNDFEPKVAAFSLQENRVSKFYRTIFKSWLTYFLSIIVLAFACANLGESDFGVLLVVSSVFNIGFSGVGVLLIISFALKNVWDTVVNEQIVKKEWKWFSTDDFLQNLEYKIKNIHMAKSYKEVSVFSRSSLFNAVNSYQNVIDCDIAHVKFNKASTSNNGYKISFSAVLRLIELKGYKIKTRYEKVNASVYGKKGVVDQPITTFREYKCSNCNSSLNILEGAVCQYCGTEFDYSDYNWVLDMYDPINNGLSPYQKAFIGFYLYFIVCFLIDLFFC